MGQGAEDLDTAWARHGEPRRTVAAQQSGEIDDGWAGFHTKPIVSADEARYRETMTDRIKPANVIPRARAIAGRRHSKKPNWVLAMDIYCVGSSYAWGICRDSGLDPEATR